MTLPIYLLVLAFLLVSTSWIWTNDNNTTDNDLGFLITMVIISVLWPLFTILLCLAIIFEALFYRGLSND